MAETLYLKDGTMYPLIGPTAFRDLLENHLGDNVARYFDGYLEDLDSQIAELEITVNTFECNADGYLQMCNSTKAELEAIMDMCRDKTTKKTQILKAIKTAWADLNNNL